MTYERGLIKHLMKNNFLKITLIAVFVLYTLQSNANLITANPVNYLSFLTTLTAGDTLLLTSGTYTGSLRLVGRNGTTAQPIVIMGSGNTTVFEGQACCNTVSITKCSYVVFKNFKCDGLHNSTIDALKAEGDSGNWAHHITVEYLEIVNYDGSRQNVGVSTKCPAWDWIIRKNRITNVGTGMYLGSPLGYWPFVNGLIENNYIGYTLGYNIQIKEQKGNYRNQYAGTAVNGKTTIRYNTFSKDLNSETGNNARPNLFLCGFPKIGWGSQDYYEVYGNFFYNNPTEALFQGTGNIRLYNNVFINHYDPGSGLRTVYFTPYDSISPQDIQVFHNTIWSNQSAGGIRIYGPDANYNQYCYANAVFAALPITNFTDSVNNITGSYSDAANYVLSASTNIASLNMYPQSGKLKGVITSDAHFQNNALYNNDFNATTYDWTYRGAYSGCCTNNGWQLQLDTMNYSTIVPTNINNVQVKNVLNIFPNPSLGLFTVNSTINQSAAIYNYIGQQVASTALTIGTNTIDCSKQPAGIYLLKTKEAIYKLMIEN
jgi:hypothetical protein